MSGGLGWQAHVYALAVLPNNDLVAAGRFDWVNGFWNVVVARWDGASWSPIGSDMVGTATSMLVMPNGDLVIGGDMVLDASSSGVAAYVARWNGTAWSSLQPPGYSTVTSLALLPNGDLLAAGDYLAGQSGDILRWDGTAWTNVPSGRQEYFATFPPCFCPRTTRNVPTFWYAAQKCSPTYLSRRGSSTPRSSRSTQWSVSRRRTSRRACAAA